MLERFDFYGAPDMDREMTERILMPRRRPERKGGLAKAGSMDVYGKGRSKTAHQAQMDRPKASRAQKLAKFGKAKSRLGPGEKMVFGKKVKVEGFWDDAFDQAMAEARLAPGEKMVFGKVVKKGGGDDNERRGVEILRKRGVPEKEIKRKVELRRKAKSFGSPGLSRLHSKGKRLTMSEAEIPARVMQDLLSIRAPSKMSSMNRYAQGRVRVLQKHGLVSVGEGGKVTLTKKGVAALREEDHWSHADLRVIFEYSMPKSIGVGGSDKKPRAAAYSILAKSAERKQLDSISKKLIAATKKQFPGRRFDSNDAAEVMYAYLTGTPFTESVSEANESPRRAAYNWLLKPENAKVVSGLVMKMAKAVRKQTGSPRFGMRDATEVVHAFMADRPLKEELEAELARLESTSSPFPEVRERRIQEVRAALQELSQNYGEMTLGELARVIRRTWKKVNYAAKPYLDAMATFDEMDPAKARYIQDPGTQIVAYFLSNASSFRGPEAKAIKAELKKRLKRK
jgi:hypothetical protein